MSSNPNFQIVIPSHSSQPTKRYRLPTADEAFKWTPLTTSPLPASDVVPIPKFAATYTTRPLTSPNERAEVSRFHPTPGQLDQIAQLLEPQSLPLYKFSRSPRRGGQPSSPVQLSHLARRVLDSSTFDYTISGERAKSSSKTSEKSSRPSTLSNSSSGPRVVVEIPQLPTYRRDQYPEAPPSPKRQKNSHWAGEDDAAQRLRTQREAGNQAVLQFQDLLSDIFDAYQVAKAALLTGQVPQGTQYLRVLGIEDGPVCCLSELALGQLQTILRQVVKFKRLDSIPSDSIQRLQDMCGTIIDASSELDLRCPADESDDEQDEWLTNVQKASLAVSAATVFLYSVRADESTSPPDTIQSIPPLVERVFDFCLTPVIEARPDGQTAPIYRTAIKIREDLRTLLDSSRKLLDVLTTTCVETSGARDCVNTTEFRTVKLIFIQNASNDKHSVLGSQAYERVRKHAMTCLGQLFAAFPQDRSPILDEILSLLDKLPSTSRNARHHKLGDGKSVMLVSALFMQLVQTAALQSSRPRGMKPPVNGESSVRGLDSPHEESEDESIDELGNGDQSEGEEGEDIFTRLSRKADQLIGPAIRSGQEIMMYMVTKASKVTKSGDSPYRNILDLFIEDLVSLMPLSEWPAAEMMLRMFAAKMIDLATTEKAAGIKNMALESLGVMGSAISDMRADAQALASSLSRDMNGNGPKTARTMSKLTDDHFASGLNIKESLGREGPFALMSHHYQDGSQSGLRAKASATFFLAQYAKFLCSTLDGHQQMQLPDEHGVELESQASEIVRKINHIVTESNTSPESASVASEVRLAYLLCLLNSGFCRRYETIVRTLLDSLSSEQAQVRSRSLKSVVTILEKDPSLPDRDPSIADDVFRCANDDSALVRDAALSLIAKFLVSRPGLEEKAVKTLLQCASDNKVGVQKRAINLLADAYAKDTRPGLRVAIARTLLQRTADVEDSVSDLARRTLNDAWTARFSFVLSKDPDSAKTTVALQDFVAHIVATLGSRLDELAPLFTSFLLWSSKDVKTKSRLHELLKKVVEILFQTVIAGKPTSATLRTLMCITEAAPEAVAPPQLTHLKSYLDCTGDDDLDLMRCVIGIFRQVLPHLSSSHEHLLTEIQQLLGKVVNRLSRRADLDEVMSCLRTLDSILGNSMRLVKMLGSVVGLIDAKNSRTTDQTRLRLLRILGSFGKQIDLEKLFLRDNIPAYRGGPVSSFITGAIYPFAVGERPEVLKKAALESLGEVCQSYPSEFNDQRYRVLFAQALSATPMFEGSDTEVKGPSPQLIVLQSFEKLFGQFVTPTDQIIKEEDEEIEVQDLKKMGGNAKVQDDNSAVTSIADYIKKSLVDIAFNGKVETTLIALRALSNIARRGMFHPRDYAAVFVALEASPEAEIRDVAGKAHLILHQQHETHWDREYVNAVYQAFKYQQRIADDPAGTFQGKAKLDVCFNVINTSGTKVVKKFLSNLVSRMGTEIPKLDVTNKIPDHFLFTRYISENISFLEYGKLDDLLHVLLQLELLFYKNGAEVSQAIEAAMNLQPEPVAAEPDVGHGADAESQTNGHVTPPPLPTSIQTPVDGDHLRRLTVGACSVTVIHEAIRHLRKLYSIGQEVRQLMEANKQAKETSKVPVRVHGVSGDGLLNRNISLLSSFEDEASMLSRCRNFHQLMMVDEEVRVSDAMGDGENGHVIDMDLDMSMPTARGRKRKSLPGSAGTTPSKKARGRPRKSGTNNRRSSSVSSRDDPDDDFVG